MGAWHEGIYGNDLAQDFLCHKKKSSQRTFF